MSKFITVLVTLSVLLCSILATIRISTSASQASLSSQTKSSNSGNSSISPIPNSSENITSVIQESSVTSKTTSLVSNSFTTKESNSQSNSTKNTSKKKIKIINGDIDTEPDTKMTKKESEDFQKCKNEEKLRRSKRNKNKPTACVKKPVEISHSATDQDYKILIDQIQEQKDVEDKKDMNKELPLSDFVDINLVDFCSDNSNMSSSSTNQSISSTSHTVSNCNSNSSSSNQSSSLPSSSNFGSSSSYSSESNSVLTSSSQSSTLAIFSTDTQSSSSSSTSSSLSSTTYSSSSSTQSSKVSFWDFLFGSIKTEAAIVSEGYRFPYPAGTRIKTNYTYNNGSTHAGHYAIDFYSVNNSNQKYNSEIVAAKSGKIFISNASTAISTGLGNNIVIQQDDGNYALYVHLSSRYFTNTGSIIARGQTIGVQGDTGTFDPYSNNSHLHFEVLQSSILNYNNSCIIDFNNCYNAFQIDQYKVYTKFDE